MRSTAQTIVFLVLVLCLAALPGAPSEPEPAGDPWNGKPRAEIVELLGEPKKVKMAGRDGETLTYKVYRGEAAALIRSGMRVIPVPGVGVVGIKPPDSASDLFATGIPVTDRASGPYQPGISDRSLPVETVTRSYDAESGEWTTTGGEKGATSTKGKIKLRFVLDAEGRVKEWSAGRK